MLGPPWPVKYWYLRPCHLLPGRSPTIHRVILQGNTLNKVILLAAIAYWVKVNVRSFVMNVSSGTPLCCIQLRDYHDDWNTRRNLYIRSTEDWEHLKCHRFVCAVFDVIYVWAHRDGLYSLLYSIYLQKEYPHHSIKNTAMAIILDISFTVYKHDYILGPKAFI